MGFVALAVFVRHSWAYDYVSAAQLYAQWTDGQRSASTARCFGYVEGVLATFVSLMADQSADETRKKNIASMAKQYLDSNIVVEQFRKNYRAGKYSGANIGASYAVVDTALGLLPRGGKQ
jgi:hypothetical protein